MMHRTGYWGVAGLLLGLGAGADVTLESGGKAATVTDAKHTIELHLDLNGRCVGDRLSVLGRQVIAPATGVCAAVKVNGAWFTTREKIETARARVEGSSLVISGIGYGPAGFGVTEEWRITGAEDHIEWTITRGYHGAGQLQDTYFPGFDFADMDTWTGGVLDSGGVVWTKYLDTPVASYGNHTGSVTFWNKDSQDCLTIASNVGAGVRDITARFSHHPSNVFSANFWPSDTELTPANGLARFLADRQDVWRETPIVADPSHPLVVTNTVTLTAAAYDSVLNLGTLKGVDGRAVRELLNTMGRYGIIDRGIAGSNGWRSSFTCTHEPWLAEFGLVLPDPKLIANYGRTLDELRRVAITPEGRVKGRWHNDDGDAMPGTFDPRSGYYEAQWGYMLDSQPSYVICVAEQFDLTGDRAWLAAHRDSCRAALEFMLRRDSDHDGLLEVIPRSHKEEKGSDWIDIVWASHENALVNAEMYEALNLWAGLEDLMGEGSQAGRYREAAARLKAAFNKPVADGGFWNPERGWYVYWREADGSIHGDNLVTPVNFAAIAYGICDDPVRRKLVLDQIETLMQKENLFHWPLCFFAFDPDDVYVRQKKFPVYENGDLFLSWAELATRAYVPVDPAIAMKYIHKVIDRYTVDGLTFQRCLRESAEGSGDDILAGNAMAIVGLYRDIYGVRPRHDRLYLDPHLTPELSGTRLMYPLRGTAYTIDLEATGATKRVTVGANGVTLAAAGPFGVDMSGGGVRYFTDSDGPAELSMSAAGAAFDVAIESWAQGASVKRAWTVRSSSGEAIAVHHVIAGLPAGAALRVSRDGVGITSVRATAGGVIEFDVGGVTGFTRLSVTPDERP